MIILSIPFQYTPHFFFVAYCVSCKKLHKGRTVCTPVSASSGIWSTAWHVADTNTGLVWWVPPSISYLGL